MHKTGPWIAATALCLALGRAGAAEPSTVRIRVDGMLAHVFVEGFSVGVTPCDVPARRGDCIRIMVGHGPRVGLTATGIWIRKSHLLMFERANFTLLYPYSGERELHFLWEDSRWYRMDGGKKVLVGLDLTGGVGEKASLSELGGRNPPFLCVKIKAQDVAGAVGKLKGIPSLAMDMRYVDDAGVAAAAYLSNLTILDISGPAGDHDRDPNTVADIAPLGALTELKRLNLDGCHDVTDISVLRKFPALQGLNLEQCEKITDLSPLSSLKNLRTLGVPPTVTDAQLSTVCKEHSGLTHLNLEYAEKLTSIAPLSGLADLEALNLDSATGIKDLSPLGNAKKLKAFGLPPTDSGARLAEICKACSQIEFLSLIRGKTSTIEPIAGLKNLKWTYFGRDAAGFNDLSPLSGLRQLRSLYIDRIPISDLSPLGRLTEMRSLGFFGCRPLTDLSPLKGMKNLGYINLQYCSKLSDLTPLSEMTELRMIELRDTNVTSLAALSDLKKLKILGLSGLKIRDMSPVYGIKGLWFIVGGKEMVGPIHTNLPDCWIGRWDKHSRGAGR